MKLRDYFRQEPVFAWSAVGLISAGAIGILDRAASPALLFDFLYLLPIALATWYSGAKSGFFVAVSSAAIWTFSQSAAAGLLAFNLNALTRLGLFLLLPSLLPAVRREWKREQESGRLDYLTGVLSRRGFLESGTLEIERTVRYQHPFSAALLDIDHFRTLNEKFGHNAADTLLRTLGRALRQQTRSTDLIGRLGADDFMLLLPETQAEAARIVIQRLQKQLLDLVEKNEWPVTFSIGAATYLQPPESIAAVQQKLESLVGAVQESGHNGFRHEVVGSVGVP